MFIINIIDAQVLEDLMASALSQGEDAQQIGFTKWQKWHGILSEQSSCFKWQIRKWHVAKKSKCSTSIHLRIKRWAQGDESHYEMRNNLADTSGKDEVDLAKFFQWIRRWHINSNEIRCQMDKVESKDPCLPVLSKLLSIMQVLEIWQLT